MTARLPGTLSNGSYYIPWPGGAVDPDESSSYRRGSADRSCHRQRRNKATAQPCPARREQEKQTPLFSISYCYHLQLNPTSPEGKGAWVMPFKRQLARVRAGSKRQRVCGFSINREHQLSLPDFQVWKQQDSSLNSK